MSRPRLLALALAAAVAATGVACGGDDGGASADQALLCDGFTALGGLDAQAPQDPAEIPAFTRDVAMPVIEQVTTNLPSSLDAQGAVIRSAFTTLADTGDFEAILTPEVNQAKAAIGARVFDRCDGATVDATGRDYAFTGVPDKLEAGPVTLRFANEGSEEHELIVLRRNDGVSGSFEELTANGPDELFGSAEFVGVAYGAPKETHYSRMDLTAGTYFFVCTLPTAGNEADPHFGHGMHQTVTVS